MDNEKWLVGRWMAHEVVSVGPDDTLVDAFEQMQEKGIRHVPVVDATGTLVGIISDRDIRRYLPTRNEVADGESAYSKKLLETGIHSVMTDAPEAVKPVTPLREASNLIIRKKIGALPVVDESKKLVGIITPEDLLWALEQNFDDLWASAGIKPV